MEIKIDQGQIIPLKEFELCWRWDDLHNPNLTADEMNQLKPLSTEESRRLSKVIGYFEIEHNLKAGYDESDWMSANCESDLKHAEFRRKLSAYVAGWEEDVLISWNRTTCLSTTKEIFVKYWDDFCYPSSDDVTIISKETNWIMFFRHFGVANIWTKRK